RRATSAGGGFPTEADGHSFGGGRQFVRNIKARSAGNRAAMDELLADESIGRMANYPIPAFQAFFYHIFSDFWMNKRTLLKKYPWLRGVFPRSPFAAVTANLGPISVSPPHLDGNNKADGMCLIGALGDFDPDLGGHIVLWDLDLIIRFPPDCSSLIPSAVITHSNTPIQTGEEHFSLIQYSAGSLFRWVANGFKTDRDWFATATEDDVVRQEEERQGRWAGALRKFTRGRMRR
ncbi:hypothetical protein K438DRAFT_1604479, partial [Mycena galopus ATCC 62051]